MAPQLEGSVLSRANVYSNGLKNRQLIWEVLEFATGIGPDHPVDEETPLNDEGEQMAEVVVTRGSPLHYQSLEGVNFGNAYGLMALAIHRARSGRTHYQP